MTSRSIHAYMEGGRASITAEDYNRLMNCWASSTSTITENIELRRILNEAMACSDIETARRMIRHRLGKLDGGK